MEDTYTSPPREYSDLALCIAQKIAKDKPIDQISPPTQLWQMYKDGKFGGIRRFPPGVDGAVFDVLKGVPDKVVYLSKSNKMPEEEYSEFESYTMVRYDHIGMMTGMLIPKWDLDNCKGDDKLHDLVERKMVPLYTSCSNALNRMMIRGAHSGREWVPGLVDYVRPVPSTDPDGGPIGGLSAVAGKAEWWRNQVEYFNAAFDTLYTASGTRDSRLFSDPAGSLTTLYQACCMNNDGEDGMPKMLWCNQTLYNMILNVPAQRQVFLNTQQNTNIPGPTPIRFQTADIVWDASYPTMNAGEGEGMFLNPRSIGPFFTEGLDTFSFNGTKEKVPGRPGFYYPGSIQGGTWCSCMRDQGLIYGVKPSKTSP